MAIVCTIRKRIFHFNFHARTSRGAMDTKTSWFFTIWNDDNPEVMGYGECGPLPGLSIDDVPEYERILHHVAAAVRVTEDLNALAANPDSIVPRSFPSILFGLETSLYDFLNGGRRVIFNNAFLKGDPIPINGLIWMGDRDFMLHQIHEKAMQGFRCLKLKIGGIDFEEECRILEAMRKRFGDAFEIRLDANGSFGDGVALGRLKVLSQFNIHSIEQPLRVGSPLLPELCSDSPIPIALDEELIHHMELNERRQLLEISRPSYIILKPSLHGGFQGCREWISQAEALGINWWMTSALESSIGLNAVCQFTGEFKTYLPQGLGTGAIYADNIGSPLTVINGSILHDATKTWDLSTL
ncbi:o-succinylbenzoate synthase [Chryseolinea sp. T2]|uniref:o-succinylbenzoate synthase n=1 Tax=Chryseolinea sp. T2 TaxID=3129255 RepID=UPI003076CA9A